MLPPTTVAVGLAASSEAAVLACRRSTKTDENNDSSERLKTYRSRHRIKSEEETSTSEDGVNEVHRERVKSKNGRKAERFELEKVSLLPRAGVPKKVPG